MSQPREYAPAVVEAKWQDAWARSAAFAPGARGRCDTFVYACTPFTTGKAHMGHVRSYTLADVCARRARAEGASVLWAMGFDAFGLPNEIAAVEHKVPPARWVEACQLRMTDQFRRLGLSTDPARTFVTSHPDYYRWTQWAFLRLLERGLAYRAEGVEKWCERCDCVLAALQVSDDGRCWRCGGEASLACVPQWYMRITPYAAELHAGLSALTGWDEAAVAYQRTLLGRIDGYEAEVALPDGGALTVFAPSAAAVSGATFVAISPNHPDLERLISRSEAAQEIEAQRRRSLNRAERRVEAIPAFACGLDVVVAGAARPLPLLVTPSVDLRFGGGAVFGAPACDPADAALARQLAIEPAPAGGDVGSLRPAVRFRLRDSSISRQRSWGAPIPVVHCQACGVVPVPDRDLPVKLPEDLTPTGRGSALAEHPDFAACACPRCGRDARRETDTLDVHIDSLWMLLPFCVPAEARSTAMFTHPDLARWLPVSQVVCGADQAA
ncbi:MAG TPA: class I tRNA ligase family protein, partial [Caulobacteraceae bacterium]|nr:class I tRNA ligase family protein [Caulobacteraceae bacterium]